MVDSTHAGIEYGEWICSNYGCVEDKSQKISVGKSTVAEKSEVPFWLHHADELFWQMDKTHLRLRDDVTDPTT